MSKLSWVRTNFFIVFFGPVAALPHAGSARRTMERISGLREKSLPPCSPFFLSLFLDPSCNARVSFLSLSFLSFRAYDPRKTIFKIPLLCIFLCIILVFFFLSRTEEKNCFLLIFPMEQKLCWKVLSEFFEQRNNLEWSPKFYESFVISPKSLFHPKLANASV